MSLKTYQVNSGAVRAGFAAFGVLTLIAAFFAAKWGFAHSAAVHSDTVEVASFAAGLAPDDPQTHYALAVQSGKTFAAEDQEKALREYELAVSLSPNNYLFWLDLGRARERSGDQAGAEGALRKALELAPSYSRVQWALGNALLRQGRNDEAFAGIRKAVAGDASYTNAATTTAWQILDGDIVLVRNAIGESARSNAALATLLASQKRFDEAFEIWNALPADEKATTLKETGQTLYKQFVEAGKFRFAAQAGSQITEGGSASIGEIVNGGFENPLSLQNSNVFRWQMADGTSPRIGPTDGQKHTGSYSLLVSFGQGSKSHRQISQIIIVEPGKSFVLEFFYRSDVKTQSKLRWEIVNAANGKLIAATGPLTPATDWTPVRVNFAVPADSDGVTIRFAAENCDAGNCLITGNIWFDDFAVETQ